MAIRNPVDLKADLPRGRRLLGIDLGTKTIGLALSDALLMGATPLSTIKRTKFTKDAEELFKVIDAREVGGLVLGLPVEMSGEEGKRAQSTRQFAANILAIRDMPLCFWDERLSTAAVERVMIEDFDMSRKKRAEKIDSHAAAFILQGVLDVIGRG
ncbi:MAG: Holliday junction resolvase RuvX [Caenispirillum bisanense]|uniref:Putative pre-16S rRNA nuclease n=1 Tax=Caenispirillum bisanense TaxID=414052 RepID=A0A286G3L0_9PROT|nr:Holliday junction resolvase RuvX [Caenispirillum bisanense]MCA1940626.1 Holliday junction resolvase RuvX [Caenispirillum bisanense]MCA1973073.1 Holliday junction resolvase RuvX [Caenispirillum sp.]SOD89806.1 putative holliday junction resolvase [Caenispirillum bisanense]